MNKTEYKPSLSLLAVSCSATVSTLLVALHFWQRPKEWTLRKHIARDAHANFEKGIQNIEKIHSIPFELGLCQPNQGYTCQQNETIASSPWMSTTSGCDRVACRRHKELGSTFIYLRRLSGILILGSHRICELSIFLILQDWCSKAGKTYIPVNHPKVNGLCILSKSDTPTNQPPLMFLFQWLTYSVHSPHNARPPD